MATSPTRTARRRRVVGARIGPFVLERFLGGGADTEVWRASGDGIVVALKLVRDPSDPLATARIAREALALRTVEHPNVVHGFDADDTDGDAWLATTLVDAGTLAHRLDEGLLDAASAGAALAPIADALAAAHAADVVHRDLSPANVLLDAAGPVLIDFGHAAIAGRTWDGWTATGAVAQARTEGYAAPDTEVSAAVDIYALGVTLLESVAGVRSLGDTTDPRRAALAAPIAELVARCCAPDPADRPTAAVVARELRALAAGRPPPGQPAPVVVDLVRAEALEELGELEDLGTSGELGDAARVGRAAELARLDHVFRTAVAAGELGAILVVAPPGTGKSWLLETALGDLHATGVHTRLARCTETVGDFRVLRPIVGDDLEDPRLGAAAAGVLRAAVGAGSGVGDATTRDLAEALVAVLQLRPAVVVVDDLHHATDELVELFGALAFRAGVPGALWLGARPGHVDPDDLGVETLALGPLDDAALRAAVVDLVGVTREVPELGVPDRGDLPDLTDLADAAVAVAGGNPWHARAAARALAAGIDLGAHADLRGVIAARLAAADERLRPALALAAASGDGFWPEAIGDELLAGAPDLVRAGYARPRVRSTLRGSSELVWSHPLLREVAYERLTELDRRVLHGRLARRFDTRSDVDEESIARHAGLAYRLGDDAIGPLTARRAAGATRDALDHYAVPRAADWVALMRETGRDRDDADVLDAEVKNREGSFTASLHLLLPHAGRDDEVGTRALVVGTESLVGIGDYERAVAWGTAARDRLVDRPRERALNARGLSVALRECGRLDDALVELDTATALFEAQGDALLAVRLGAQATEVATYLDHAARRPPTDSIERAKRVAAKLRQLDDRRGLVEFAATSAADSLGIEQPEMALELQRSAFDAAQLLDDAPVLARCAFRLLGAANDAERPDVAARTISHLRDPPVDAMSRLRMQIAAESYLAAVDGTTAPNAPNAGLDELAAALNDESLSADQFTAVAAHLWRGEVGAATTLLDRLGGTERSPSSFDLLARLQIVLLTGPPFDVDLEFPATTAFHSERAAIEYLRGDPRRGDELLAERDEFLRTTASLHQPYGPNFTQRLLMVLSPTSGPEARGWFERQLLDPPYPAIWVLHRALTALLLAERSSTDRARLGAAARRLRASVRPDPVVAAWLDPRLARLG